MSRHSGPLAWSHGDQQGAEGLVEFVRAVSCSGSGRGQFLRVHRARNLIRNSLCEANPSLRLATAYQIASQRPIFGQHWDFLGER